LALLLAGCSGPIGLYHNVEGGAIAGPLQPPPGADLPYPNLADVPPNPPPFVMTPAKPDVSPPAPGALAGLELPTAPPPPPNVPGLNLPATPSTPAAAPAPAAMAVVTPTDSAPIALAFQPGMAILPAAEIPALRNLAATRGNATLLVGGFGDDTSLTLALARAQRLADALTASGVPAADIHLVAAQAGSGGFVQFVY
jgi:hypothetical protein